MLEPSCGVRSARLCATAVQPGPARPSHFATALEYCTKKSDEPHAPALERRFEERDAKGWHLEVASRSSAISSVYRRTMKRECSNYLVCFFWGVKDTSKCSCKCLRTQTPVAKVVDRRRPSSRSCRSIGTNQMSTTSRFVLNKARQAVHLP